MSTSPSNPLRSRAPLAIGVFPAGGVQALARGFPGRPPPHVCERP